jgi:hypothetical protein
VDNDNYNTFCTIWSLLLLSKKLVASVSVHAIFWGIMPEESGSSESLILDSYVIVGRGFFFGIFNIWFGLEVIRYFKDYNRKRMVIIAGVLSLVYPSVLAVVSWPWIRYSESFVYMGSIPIQFIISILLMRCFGEPELASPWTDEYKPVNKES